MSRLLFLLVALVAVAFAVLIFAPNVIPVAAYKARIETAASAAVGREVTIGDHLEFRILPRTAFHVNDLEIANAEGFDGPYLARVGEADIGVNLIKLLSGAVEIERFVLADADIQLARKADGRVNWNLSDPEETVGGAAEGEGVAIRDVRLGVMRIVDGRARFSDEAAGKSYAAANIDLSVVLESLNEPLEAKGTMVFQGAPATVDIVLTSPADIIAGKPSNLKFDIQAGKAAAGADLTFETAETLRYKGPLRLDAPDLPAFAALLGMAIEDAPGFDRFAATGEVDGGAESLRLSNADITFDDITAQGALRLDWSGARPKAGGVLSTDKLDLRPYMPPPAESAEGFPAWSEAHIDFSSLRNMDADFDISTNAIFINDLKFGESRLKLVIDNGRLTADIPELSMYGGQGSGRVVVNARRATPTFSGNFDLGAVEAQPLSADLFKHDNLLGIGAFKFNFTASGASQAAIMETMDGGGGFDLANGALKGVNIAKIVRAVGALREGINPAALQAAVTAARGPAEQTDFSEFLSNFEITDGLMNAPSISLKGPYLTMTGKGVVNLPAQTIDIRLSPRATDTADGQGGRALSVPVRVGGTFASPTIGIDAEALVRSGFEQTLRDVLQGSGKKDSDAENTDGADQQQTPEDAARNVLEGILSGPKKDGNDNGEQGGASIEDSPASEALKSIFGVKKKPAAEEPAPDEPASSEPE